MRCHSSANNNNKKFRIPPFISSSSSCILHLSSRKAVHLLDLEYSRKIFVFGYSFEPGPFSLALGRAGSVTTVGLSINRCSHSEQTSLTRENKTDQSRSSGFGDCKRSTRFRQNLFFYSPGLFSSSPRRQKDSLIAGCVYNELSKQKAPIQLDRSVVRAALTGFAEVLSSNPVQA